MINSHLYINNPEKDNPLWFEYIKGGFPQNRVIGICNLRWIGIKHATEKQCSEVILIEKISSEEHAQAICKSIKEKGFEKIAINGLPDNIELLIKTAPKYELKTYVIFHGSFTQQPFETGVIRKFNKIYPYFKNIYKFGFVRKGMELTFKRLGVQAEFVPNSYDETNFKESTRLGETVNIGVPSIFYNYKNNLNQIIAAAYVSKSTVHVLDLPNIRYLELILKGKVIKHGKLPYDKFLEFIKEMDVNCYVSISECYPMVFLESLSRSVPCLIGKTSEFMIEDEPELKKYLLVQNPEDIFEIQKKIEEILHDYPHVVDLCQKYIVDILEKNRKIILNFFNS